MISDEQATVNVCNSFERVTYKLACRICNLQKELDNRPTREELNKTKEELETMKRDLENTRLMLKWTSDLKE